MSGYTIAHLEEIDEISDGREPMRPVRHHFGITSFGVNAWTGHEAGDRIINEHDEGGTSTRSSTSWPRAAPSSSWTGERRGAPAGHVRLRRARRDAHRVRRGAGDDAPRHGRGARRAYVPDGWELWSELRPLFDAGDYEAVAERGKELVAQNPQRYPTLLYNVACAEALTGRKEDAIEHLRRSIALDERGREYAKGDSDFDSLRDEPAFKELVG